MRFKTTPLSLDIKHSSLVNCVAWVSNEELYSCGDDHALIRWSCIGKAASKIAELPEEIFPTSLHCLPRLTSSSKSGSDLVLLLTTADGKLLLLSATGRLEKTVEAHKAAILTSRVSRDGSSIVTGAEDGSVRVWSRSAMLRSTVATTSIAPVFACDWSPDSQSVAYAQGGTIVLKPLSPSLSVTKWQGHEGIILSLAWSPSTTATLATGAEDCRYKVWDTEGRLLYSCPSQGAPVTSLAWSWDGALLAVGAHNSLRLSLATGWSCWVERLGRGGIQGLAWSKDNSQVAIACGSGHVLSACIIDREVEAGSVQAHMTEQKIVRVRDLKVSDHWEVLEMKSPVLFLIVGFDHVAVATSSQCLVYNINSLNTPAEIKLPGVMLLQLTAKYILAVNESGFWVFTLEGRPVNLPRLPTLATSSLTQELISLSLDALAVRDNVDQRVVHLLGVGSLRGSESQPPRVRHSDPVKAVTLSQTETERCLALVDTRGDMYLIPNPMAPNAKSYKLCTMVRSMIWNAASSYLAVLTESSLMVWFYPQTVAIDSSLLANTLVERDLSEFGTSATLLQFYGCLLEVKRQDQVTVTIAFSPAPAALYIATEKGQWDKALALVRRASHASGLRAGCMHSIYAVRCRAKLQPKRALVAYTALGCVDTVEMLLAQE